jgi:hypothetical protein
LFFIVESRVSGQSQKIGNGTEGGEALPECEKQGILFIRKNERYL